MEFSKFTLLSRKSPFAELLLCNLVYSTRPWGQPHETFFHVIFLKARSFQLTVTNMFTHIKWSSLQKCE
jgi:hypothetical protein